MKRTELLPKVLLVFVLISCQCVPKTNRDETTSFPTATSDALYRQPLSLEEQRALLSSKCPHQMMRAGSFDGFASYVYATADIALHTDSTEVAQTRLIDIFPDFYEPTYEELFDVIARQTLSTWNYDALRDYWAFDPPPGELPYEIEIADGWKYEDRGAYVLYRPEIAPVGMDIYFLGCYSADTNEEELFIQVRDTHAVKMAARLWPEVTLGDMKVVEVNGVESMYVEIVGSEEGPLRDGVTWRQWVFVKSGCAYGIVSAIDNINEGLLLPDVHAMVESFEVKNRK